MKRQTIIERLRAKGVGVFTRADGSLWADFYAERGKATDWAAELRSMCPRSGAAAEMLVTLVDSRGRERSCWKITACFPSAAELWRLCSTPSAALPKGFHVKRDGVDGISPWPVIDERDNYQFDGQ